MDWVEARVVYEAGAPALAADLIADVFYGFGVKGVVIEDPDPGPMPAAPGEEFQPAAHYAVGGYFPADTFGAAQCRAFEAAVARLGQRAGIRWHAAYRKVADEDWAESWKAYFWPERVAERIVVKPSWREYTPRKGDVILEIDPGMAFGTGTHPTTALCIQLIEAYLKPGAHMLDVGTGSGILMAAAALLGAGIVHGVDNDAVAVAVARENLLRNHIPQPRFGLWVGTLVEGVTANYDLVCANILAEVIVELIPDLNQILVPGGVFVCSGIVAEKSATVMAALSAAGFGIREVRKREGWCAIAAKCT
jgi:ribosomal protein L11 methyltransferase